MDIAGTHMGTHRAALVAALCKDRIAPERGDPRLMRRPVRDMGGKDRAQFFMTTDRAIEGGDDLIDLGGGEREARRKHDRDMACRAPRGKMAGCRARPRALHRARACLVLAGRCGLSYNRAHVQHPRRQFRPDHSN